MQYEIKIDPDCQDPKIVIHTAVMTDEIESLVTRLSASPLPFLIGFCDYQAQIIEIETIIRIYAEQGKVIAETEKEKYLLKLRLYETELRLPSDSFVRISHSEIVNLKKVKSFDLSLTGVISIRMQDRSVSSVSRRYIPKIKNILGL